MKFRARRRDANEPDVVSALQAVGAGVERLDARGCPDLLVGFRNRLYLLEVKSPDGGVSSRSVHRGRGNTLEGPLSGLTPDQREWWAHWKGPAPAIVQSADEALRAIGVELTSCPRTLPVADPLSVDTAGIERNSRAAQRERRGK